MQRHEVKFSTEGVSANGSFAGYGSIFGNIDAYGDVVAKGAFSQSLESWKASGKYPPMLLQHGMAEDGLPVGKWTLMREDDKGLYVEGRLINMDTERGKSIYGALSEGVLDGLSIGYRVREFSQRTRAEEPRRTLKAVDLVELSIVTMPANDKARISSVKSLTDLCADDFRDIEAILRTKGLSRADAVKAVSGFKDWLQRDAGDAEKSARDERDTAITDLVRFMRDHTKGA